MILKMKKFKLLQLQILNKHIANISICDRPSGGWIRAIRTAICMNTRQLAERIGVARQATAKLENNELNDSITLKTLRKAAEAMGCKLVYAFVPPQGSLEDIVKKQAYKKAQELIEPINHTMLLEAQEVGDLKERITEAADELTNDLNSKLWDK